MYKTRWRSVGVGLAAAAVVATSAAPARAGYKILSSTFDDVVARESVGMETGLFGDRTFREQYPQTIALQPMLGVFGGSSSTLSGAGASYHTTRFAPWDFGAGVSLLDLDIRTWTFAVSMGYRAWSHGRSLVLFDGGLGYQFMHNASGDNTAIRLDRAGNPAGDLVLIDSFDFFHAALQGTFTTQVAFFHPMVSVGWVGTRYRFDAKGWDGSFPVTQGAPRHENGTTANATFGVGASVDVHRASLFGGVRAVQDAVVFQLNLGLVF